MRFKIAFLSLVTIMSAGSGFAQDSTTAKKAESSKIRPYNEVITSKAITKSGLFNVYTVGDKYYFEIPDSLLQREFLFTTRLVKVPTGSPMFGGEIVNSIIIAFEKASEDKLYLRVVTNVAVSDSSDAITKAVRNSTIDPIVMVMDVKAKSKNGKGSLIEVTDFVLKDNNITGFDPAAKKAMYIGGAAADRSFIVSANSFSQNIEIKTVKTFSLGAAPKPEGADAGAAPASTTGNVTMELSNSIMLLPTHQMAARHADPRVGYYSENYKVFSDRQQKVEEKNFIVRQRLEPKTEDLDRYKNGELVEPKEPIVYYIDPSTPKQWRPYIIAGINDWNEAFKAAGFKNAIIGKEWPENDSTMSLEDARCKVVRYFPSSQAFTSTPRIYDPRSGEILQTYIGWSHSKLKSLHEWYFVQASATDPTARTMTFSNELMGALIRADISRQVGYSLGLRNNLIGSYAYPVEKLRDKNWVEANGFSASIMDNIHYNYVAQPEDRISPKGMIPQIGEYDKWAIKYGYTYTGNNDFDKEKKTVLSWINKMQTTNTALKFAVDRDVNPNDPADPRALSEDLSSNQVKAGEYAIKNMKIVMANLLTWTREDMDMYDNTARMYDNVMDWWLIVMRHAYAQLGGVREDIKTVEQSGDVYSPVTKEMQKQAMAFLQKEVFQTPTWLLDPTVLNKFSKPAKREKVQRFQAETVYQLMKSDRLFKMTVEEMRYGKANIYTLDEMMTDLENSLWSELKTTNPVINANRRSIQKSWLENINRVIREVTTAPAPGSGSVDMTNTDVPVIVRAHMEKVMQQCKAAAVNCKDPMTLAHIRYTQAKLDKLLNPKN